MRRRDGVEVRAEEEGESGQVLLDVLRWGDAGQGRVSCLFGLFGQSRG